MLTKMDSSGSNPVDYNKRKICKPFLKQLFCTFSDMIEPHMPPSFMGASSKSILVVSTSPTFTYPEIMIVHNIAVCQGISSNMHLAALTFQNMSTWQSKCYPQKYQTKTPASHSAHKPILLYDSSAALHRLSTHKEGYS